MKLILGRADIDIESKDMFGSGLLSRAAGGGIRPKPSLDRNVDANAKDEEAEEILSNAAAIGAVAIAKLLLDCKDDSIMGGSRRRI